MTKDYKQELNHVHLRATPARIAVMHFLESTDTPVDTATIMEYLRSHAIAADPATVFRMMNMFTQKGITTPVQFYEGKTRYELANKADHHHLICEQCGKVEDVEDTAVPGLQKHIEEEHHFLVKRHSLEFFGLCASCQQ